MLIFSRTKHDDYVVIPYRRPTWDSLHYACHPVIVYSAGVVEQAIFDRLDADMLDTKLGSERDSLPFLQWSENAGGTPTASTPANLGPGTHQIFDWSRKQETKLLTDALAISLGPKGMIGGFADVFRFSPCTIAQRRLHKVLTKDASLNIEVPYPMTIKQFSEAFRLAFKRAEDD